MLGEVLGEEKGKITGSRVLPSEGQGPIVETSTQGSGKVLGVEYTSMDTYCTNLAQGGMLHGEGRGIIMTKDGEMASWTGQGVGKPKGGVAGSFRGAMYFQTTSQKLARLNTVAALYEFEVEEDGSYRGKLWEWK